MERIGARLGELLHRPAVLQALRHRDPGSEIAQMAVLTGAVVAVGIGVALGFMTGMGAFFTNMATKIQQMVP